MTHTLDNMKAKERLYSLDILKFILAVLIAIWHLDQMFGISFPYSQIIFEQIRLDNVVDMFFIISGFLSLYNYKKQNFDSFITTKVKRLYPLAILSVIISIILMAIYRIVNGVDFFDTGLGLWNIFNSLLLTHTGGAIVAERSINNPLWYVSVLMICYSVFWLITKNGKDDKKYLFLLVCLIGLGIHEYQINLPFINIYTGRGCAGFFLGSYLCNIYEKYENNITSKSFFIIPLCILFGIVGLLMYDYTYFVDNKWCIDTFIVSPLIIFISLGLNRYICKYDKLSMLSNISYSVYIWHYVILIIYGLFNKNICTFIDMVVYVLIVIVYSIFSYTFIEKKLNKLINK